jgi:hypothetical protein
MSCCSERDRDFGGKYCFYLQGIKAKQVINSSARRLHLLVSWLAYSSAYLKYTTLKHTSSTPLSHRRESAYKTEQSISLIDLTLSRSVAMCRVSRCTTGSFLSSRTVMKFRVWRKSWKMSIRRASIRTEIWTQDLPNMNEYSPFVCKIQIYLCELMWYVQ